MTRSQTGTLTRLAVTRAVSLIAGAFLIASCTKKEPAPTDTPTPTPATQVNTSSNAPALQGNQGFDFPLDSLAGPTQGYIASNLDFTYTSGKLEDDFACADPAKCPPNGTVKLRIIPDRHAENRDWLKVVTGKKIEGYIVARLENIDPRNNTLDVLNLAPGQFAYQWVGQLKSNDPERGVGFYNIDANGKVDPKIQIIQSIQHCDDDDPLGSPNPGKKPKVAKMPNHSNSLCWKLSRGGGKARLVRKPLFPSAGLWISCSGGCCQVSQS